MADNGQAKVPQQAEEPLALGGGDLMTRLVRRDACQLDKESNHLAGQELLQDVAESALAEAVEIALQPPVQLLVGKGGLQVDGQL